jgi:valyl-tRNA synthetase
MPPGEKKILKPLDSAYKPIAVESVWYEWWEKDGNPAGQELVKQTLYTTIEGALLMIHPLTPYISEELWQRLPRRPGDKTTSICIAKYPTYDAELDDPKSEEAYELVMAVSRGVRSLMSQYAIKDKGESKFP